MTVSCLIRIQFHFSTLTIPYNYTCYDKCLLKRHFNPVFIDFLLAGFYLINTQSYIIKSLKIDRIAGSTFQFYMYNIPIVETMILLLLKQNSVINSFSFRHKLQKMHFRYVSYWISRFFKHYFRRD